MAAWYVKVEFGDGGEGVPITDYVTFDPEFEKGFSLGVGGSFATRFGTKGAAEAARFLLVARAPHLIGRVILERHPAHGRRG